MDAVDVLPRKFSKTVKQARAEGAIENCWKNRALKNLIV